MRKRSIHPVPPLAGPPGGPPSGSTNGAPSAPEHTTQGQHADAQPPAIDQPVGEPATTPPGPEVTPQGLDKSGGLVWPPPDDDMKEWEVLHLQTSGHTIIEPMNYTPPAHSDVGRGCARADDSGQAVQQSGAGCTATAARVSDARAARRVDAGRPVGRHRRGVARAGRSASDEVVRACNTASVFAGHVLSRGGFATS